MVPYFDLWYKNSLMQLYKKLINIILGIFVSTILNISGLLKVVYNPSTTAGQYSPVIAPLIVIIIIILLGLCSFPANRIRRNQSFYFTSKNKQIVLLAFIIYLNKTG